MLRMSQSTPQLSAEQKANLQEVADLMLQIYETLAEMRYLDPKGIIHGPHNLSHLSSMKNDLDPTILHLYSILPYVDQEESGQTAFFHEGQFADFRNTEHVKRGRDPFYKDPESEDFEAENGPYMRPWATLLSNLGDNYSTVMIYDARLHRIWAIDLWGNQKDPELCSKRGTAYEVPKSDWGSDSSGEFECEDALSCVSEDSSEFWSDGSEFSSMELELLQRDQRDESISFDEGFECVGSNEQREAEEATRSKNEHDFYHVRSRPAGEFLRSVNQWYRELKEVPGQGFDAGREWMERDILKPLYERNGWPDNFDGDAFKIDQARTYCAQRAKSRAEGPLRDVDCDEGWLEDEERDVERLKQQLTDAEDEDERWMAQFKLWQVEQSNARNIEDLRDRKEKAELQCPGGVCQREEDLPLWEMEMMRVETQGRYVAVNRSRPESAAQRHARKKAAVYQAAYEASTADANRLCPGRTFEQATGIKSLGRCDTKTNIEHSKYSIECTKGEIQKLKDWTTQLPEGQDLPKTRQLIEHEIAENEKSLINSRKGLERSENCLAEHGNIDY